MASKEQVHFVLIPFMCPGHLIPMADMARLIARHRATVTIITSPNNAARIQSPVQRAANSGLSIRLVKLRFPSTEFGLPEGCESIDALPSIGLVRNFFLANKALQDTIVEVLKKTEPAPSCIVSDRMLAWTGSVAKSLGIPRVIFDGMSCFTLLLIHNLYLYKPYESVSDSSEPFVVPGVPGQIEFTRAQLPGMFNPSSAVEMEDIRAEIRASEKEAYGVVVNSFEEMEPDFATLYGKLMNNKVWCVGPVSLCNDNIVDMLQRGHTPNNNSDFNNLTKWLDSRPIGSVIYCCLGSLNRVTCRQMVELGLGLEGSGSPFIWVIRGAVQGLELEQWLEEDGFETRVKERGLVLRGWVPQVLILSHPSVGGFLTHCGWNSTLEGVAYGVPMVTWPLFAEQFFNEKEVVEVLRVGVAVGAKVVVHLGEEEENDVAAAVVKSEDIRMAVEKVVDGGEEGEGRRKRAKELAEMANKAVAKGGSSYANVIAMIEDIRCHISSIN